MSPGTERRSLYVGALVLSIVLGILYLGNGRTLGSGDTLPARQLPVSILRHGNLYLDDFMAQYWQASVHSVQYVRGHWVSNYPVGAALFAIPFYLPLVVGPLAPQTLPLEPMEKVAASGITILSALVLLLALSMLTRPVAAWVVALVYGVCTSSFSTSSQALWQHGPGQLAMTCGFYALLRGASDRRWISLSGFPLALAVLCRPTNALLVAPIALYVVIHHTRRTPWFVLSSIPVAVFFVWYNFTYFGTAIHSQFPLTPKYFWATPFFEGFLGLLASPGRGLFIYSPILLLSLVGIVKAWRASQQGPGYLLVKYSTLGVLLTILVHSKWWSWWGGLCYGPRLLADALPALCLALYPVADAVIVRWRVIGATLALCSFLAHFAGSYWDDGHWTGYALPEGLWSWRDSPLVNPVKEIMNRQLISMRNLPTSSDYPERLSASYLSMLGSSPLAGKVGAQVRVNVRVSNDGDSVWIAWPKAKKGTVQLEWILRPDESTEGPTPRGIVPLRHDVFHGEVYEFPVVLNLAGKPGNYTLQLGLVCVHGPSFSDLGVQPLTFDVSVAPRKLGIPDHLVHPNGDS